MAETKKARPLHRPLLVLGVLSLMAGLWAGLQRLGWGAPGLHPQWALLHGPFMVCGFLGTLIAVERAVALGRPLAYVAPALSAASVALMLAGVRQDVTAAVAAAAATGLTGTYGIIFQAQPAWHVVTMTLGAASWLVGDVVWLVGRPFFEAVPFWMLFPVLTIAGERQEMSKWTMPTLSTASGGAARLAVALRWAVYGVALALLLGGALATLWKRDVGPRVGGVGQVIFAFWFLTHDISGRTFGRGGLPRFSALCVLSGFVWLAIGGVLLIEAGGAAAGPLYDAALHSVFLGFVFMLIFGHAPIIFPAVMGHAIPFHPRFYGHVVLLHASLILRVAGDLGGEPAWRLWGGLGNAAAIVIFFANNIASVLAARRARLGA